MKKLIVFQLRGKFGHFLRAEAGASALSYPFPPRTVMLGIIGAVLGLDKDKPQTLLEPLEIAVSGKVPLTHWHRAKFRKDPPESLPQVVKRSQKSNSKSKPEKATLILQEWLLNPSYTIWALLPQPYHNELELRLKERRWHYQISLGLSEMMADIEYLETIDIKKMPYGKYPVASIIKQISVNLDLDYVFEHNLAIQLQRMPKTVTPNRLFTHESYIIEKNGQPVVVETGDAYQVGDKVLMFL